MKKRIKKKLGTNFNHLKLVKRQMHNRLGQEKYIDFEIIPMGYKDELVFKKEYYPEFQFASHWFVEFFYEKLPNKYVVIIRPCTKNGRINERNGFLRAFAFKKQEDILAVFKQVIADMKHDLFMRNFGSYYYDDMLFNQETRD